MLGGIATVLHTWCMAKTSPRSAPTRTPRRGQGKRPKPHRLVVLVDDRLYAKLASDVQRQASTKFPVPSMADIARDLLGRPFGGDQ